MSRRAPVQAAPQPPGAWFTGSVHPQILKQAIRAHAKDICNGLTEHTKLALELHENDTADTGQQPPQTAQWLKDLQREFQTYEDEADSRDRGVKNEIEKYNKLLETLRAMIDGAQRAAKAEQAAEIAALKKKLADEQDTVSKLRGNNSADAKQLEEASKKLSELNNQLEGCNKREYQLVLQLREAKTRGDKFVADSKKWKAEADAKEKEKLALNGDLQALRKERDGQKKLLEEKDKQLKKCNDDLRAEMEVAITANDVLQKQIAELMAKIAELEKKAANDDATKGAARAELEEAANLLKNNKKKRDDLEAELAKANAKLEKATQRLKGLFEQDKAGAGPPAPAPRPAVPGNI
tara:strand:+ start:225 stop:1280 length:1056 start_codon:yes stop_codon:yes gene_type:complete